MSIFNRKKLCFEIGSGESEISLAEALSGAVGTVTIGKQGVALWVPGDNTPKHQEMVFDLRNRPLSEKDGIAFQKACRGHFMPAHIALLKTRSEKRIRKVLEQFDYVLTPNKQIKNIPADFRNRILSYTHAKES